VVAIARPGALDFKDRYAEYVEEQENPSLFMSFLMTFLVIQVGIPLYQEQLMKMAVKGGL
jgi:DNA polymerase III alpha subunit